MELHDIILKYYFKIWLNTKTLCRSKDIYDTNITNNNKYKLRKKQFKKLIIIVYIYKGEIAHLP